MQVCLAGVLKRTDYEVFLWPLRCWCVGSSTAAMATAVKECCCQTAAPPLHRVDERVTADVVPINRSRPMCVCGCARARPGGVVGGVLCPIHMV